MPMPTMPPPIGNPEDAMVSITKIKLQTHNVKGEMNEDQKVKLFVI